MHAAAGPRLGEAHPPTRADDLFTYGTDVNGITRALNVNRYPALYTGDFGDCLGGESLFNITKFDAGYYADNLTIVFHLDGTSNIRNESLMMHISVEAYGEERYGMTFDPCRANIYSLCPLNASVPITGWALFPVGPQQIGGIPPIAFSIPDFEGFAKLRIFANSSRTEIGCFQAVMNNGNSFSQPGVVAPVLAAFTAVAIIASFLTATYGVSVRHMRMHYAHSLPVLVVFEVFQTIFFSGALQLNWPNVLVAWWSNFAWSAGMIYSSSIINSVNKASWVTGNASQVGGAGSIVINNGGGLTTQIYGRSLVAGGAGGLASRSTYNASNPYDYTWAGDPIAPGMPLPGTWNGFSGALSIVGIPSADAFLVGLIWLLVALALVALIMTVFKYLLETLVHWKKIKPDRLGFFRDEWLRFLALTLQRTLLMAFFMVMTLTLFQFATGGSPTTLAVAAVVFVLMFGGFAFALTRAMRTRTRLGRFHVSTDEIIFHHAKIFKLIPVIAVTRASVLSERELQVRSIAGVPILRIQHLNEKSDVTPVHQDRGYLERHGWLSSRYRRTKWWFFSYYLCYQFVRACFVGAAANQPLAQVCGLLIYDILAFIVILALNPYEGSRNTAIAVWMLGLSKILTTGLSIAFLPGSNMDRIIATAIGIIIIVIQGLLVIGLLILIVLSVVSSWLSMSRNQEMFQPDWLDSVRIRYFERVQERAPDQWVPPKKSDKARGKEKQGEEEAKPAEPPQPYFSVKSVRRAPKIEDEDDDVVTDLEATAEGASSAAVAPKAAAARNATRQSRANSVVSGYSHSAIVTMTKGTSSFGKRHTKTHGLCRRCGRRSMHNQTKICAACGYPSAKIRKYNWSEKAKRRKVTGTGRMRYLSTVSRRFKNGFQTGTPKGARGPLAR
ncbi:hypothetical protein P8C59_001161 [Phyllachora maydis]|uniref:ML-like domain-containing protein n=1 Tax=Phyllachora maydis TaxID=1825666 RepID=A0AAD9HZ57_9PEZI|nr:hypothetical protein P8C59_001161 [Phyllachora maydis]